MKTMMEALAEARAKGNDVTISDGYMYLEERWDGNWYVCNEVDWHVDEEEVLMMEVVKVTHDSDGVTFIDVVEIDV
jgi:hypothetical protein